MNQAAKPPSGTLEDRQVAGSLVQATRIPVVGVGASAGGFEAIGRFLESLPPSPGMAFVVIEHLSPDHTSFMAETLARSTPLKVVQAKDGMGVEPDSVYVIPPNAYLTLEGSTLRLGAPAPVKGLRMPIDAFFRSLAQEYGDRAIGVILSGSGSDGTLGIRAIKELGGLVLCQDPATAQHSGMPRSAIDTGLVDQVQAPEEMPETLARYVAGYLEGPLWEHEAAEGPSGTTAWHGPILAMLLARTGHDFRKYKQGTVRRRILRRMGLRGISTFDGYAEVLKSDSAELNRLHKDLLIGVTQFFRDPDAFEILSAEVLRQIVTGRALDEPIRIWVPACASGEEPYSIAIALAEEMQRAVTTLPVKVFATDIDPEALKQARAGCYSQSIAADVAPDLLEKYFVAGGEYYQVKKEIRDMVVFAEHDLLRDPPFSRMDLISCRNALIYLEPAFQERVIGLLHFALRDGGYMFLGNTESVGLLKDKFRPISKKWRIFQRVGPRQRPVPDYLLASPTRRPDVTEPRAPARNTLGQIVTRQLLAEFAPAAVLVNDRLEVLYLEGAIGRFLDLPRGEPRLDLMTMSPLPLRNAIRGAIDEARHSGSRSTRTAPQKDGDQGQASATILVTALPVAGPDGDGLFLLAFEEKAATGVPALPASADEHNIVNQLEEEIRRTREDLLATIQASEESSEELKASNEEVMSMNEELQSANEELETAKEELQSLNEELNTVNAELLSKVDDLEKANDDLTNLLASTDQATVFLDVDMRIKRFTPATVRILNLIPGDVGRPIGDLTSTFKDSTLLADAREVLAHLAPQEREVETQQGRWYLRRITPYRTGDDHIRGVVITFADVTRIKESEESLRRSRDKLAKVLSSLDVTVMVLDAKSRAVEACNQAAKTMLGYDPAELIGGTLGPLFVTPDDFETLWRHVSPTAGASNQGRWTGSLRHRDGRTFHAEIAGKLLESEGARQVVCIVWDISDRIRQEQDRLRQVELEVMNHSLQEADRLKRNFINAASHELRTPLSSVVGYAEFLEDELAGPLTGEQRLYVLQIQENTKRLQRLVDDLLDFARMEAGSFEIVKEESDLGSKISSAVESLRPLAAEAGLELVLDLPDRPVPVVMDAGRIEQVILNLAGNAIRFTPTGGKVTVAAKLTDDHVRVEVRDTGKGIAPEHLPRLFEKFYQVDPSLTREHGGAGLGLAISQAIVKAHGGEIGVESEVGVGSTFWFTLPKVA